MQQPGKGKILIKRWINKQEKTISMNNIQFDHSLYKKLSPREQEVARAAKEGRSIQETADLLGVKPSTIKQYRCRLMTKLGAKNITETVVSLISAGIL